MKADQIEPIYTVRDVAEQLKRDTSDCLQLDK